MTTATRKMSGVRKCAVLCLALPPEDASELLRQLAPPEVEAVLREVNALHEVEPEVVQTVLDEYQSAATAGDLPVRGGETAARRIAGELAGPDGADSLLERVRRPAEPVGLARLEKVEPRMFAGILQDEHPQTVAVILSHLDLKQATRAVEELPPDLAADVLLRMARMDRIQPEALSVIEEGLRSRADLSLTQDLDAPGDAARVAKLLNMTGGGRDEDLLGRIQERNGELAERIKALMFVFEDLLLVEKKGVQQVLREVDNKDLALALKGASEELRSHLFSSMSERAATALEEEIELLGAVRVKDVEAAQQRIMEEVRRLEDAGEIVVRREGEDDDFIA